MFIGSFTERPYQDPKARYFGGSKEELTDLVLSNGEYDSVVAHDLYNRYFDEKLYAEQIGFDGLMLNEHHSTPFTMGSVCNVEAAILARITSKAKIVLLGNLLAVRSDPIFLAEELAMIDVISKGRLISGWVRGTGRESLSHNAQSPYNWERFQEAHELIVKTWTDPGPFRWEGQHYQLRYVNPWAKPYQKPHMPIWVPGVLSYNTLEWAARKRYPYIMTATDEGPTAECFELYRTVARENGYEAGPQNYGYMIKLHVDETEDLAEDTARKLLQGPSNPFLEGNQGSVKPWLQALPGLTSKKRLLPTIASRAALAGRGLSTSGFEAGSYEDQRSKRGIIAGTPKTVIAQLRIALEKLRPGIVMIWDGDGAMTHDDTMRSMRLMGETVLPAIREMAREFDLPGPFEADPTGGAAPTAEAELATAD